MVTSTIQHQPPATRKAEQTPQVRERWDGDREDRVVGSAFGAMLAITRGTIGARIQRDGDLATAQMFDEDGDGKVAQLSEEYRAAVGEKSDRLSDARTGIDARSHEAIAEAGRPDANAATAALDLAKGDTAKGEDHPASLGQTASRLDGQAATNAFGEESPRLNLETQPRATPPKVEANVPPPMDPARVSNANAGLSAVASSAPPGSANVAEEIGQLLGASRIGESRGARTTAAVQGAPDQRASSDGRQAETSARSKQPPASTEANEPKRANESNRTRFDKLVGSMRLRMGDHRSTAQLRLNPPELGRIRVDVRLVGERLVVGVQAETDSARELLTHRLDGLKATLKEHGILVDRFDIVTDGSADSPDSSLAGGHDSGAQPFSRGSMQPSPPPSSLVTPGGAQEDHDGSEAAGTAVLGPTVAGETRLDIRI